MRMNGWGNKQEIVHIEPSKKVKEETETILMQYKEKVSLLKHEIVELNAKRKVVKEESHNEYVEKEQKLIERENKIVEQEAKLAKQFISYFTFQEALKKKEKEVEAQHLFDRAYYDKYNSQKEKAQDDIRKDTVKLNYALEELKEKKEAFAKERADFEKQHFANSTVLQRAEDRMKEVIARENELEKFQIDFKIEKEVQDTKMGLKYLQDRELRNNIAINAELQKTADMAMLELEDQKKSILERENRIRQNKQNQERMAIKLQEKEEHLSDWESALQHDSTDLDKRREILKKKSRG